MESIISRLKVQSDEAIKIIEKHDPSIIDSERYRVRLTDLQRVFSHEVDVGLNCGKFKFLQKATDGFPRKSSFIGLAGASNIGKTSWLRNLTWEMLAANPNLIIIFMSIDDQFQKIIPAYIALNSVKDINDSSGLEINEVIRAKTKIWEDTIKKGKWQEGWKKIHDLSERLIVKDILDGNTTIALEKYIEYYKNKHPNKDIVAVVDNFHRLQDFNWEDSRKKAEDISARIKFLTGKYDMPIICTLELRKLERFNARPTLDDVKETGGIVYDADIVMLAYQDMHVNDDTPVFWSTKTNLSNNVKMPYFEIKFAKNKAGGFKGNAYFKFRTDSSYFEEVDYSEVINKYNQKKNKNQGERISIF